ncbi:non-homologous end joining protein Ku [Streptomyces antimicrobicus]|uniref:Non-homologous end joining protein Ku n=1 Tax=Streptomyces antimicrobicus TaxID=2883108 RepID=A0ABS8B595_9ACTN|nr:Ku protein [Streptomyces antimicrobicus]MCB5179785.1 Ku protein [Streptomyces antimicrobicus]
MARPVWTGVLTFGLVSVPIGVYTATDSHTPHFHQLQRGTADRIRNRRVNERTGKEVDADDIVKGYDVGEEYVVVEPAELEEIAPGRSKALEIRGFVDLDEIDPIFFDRTYYVGPRGKEYATVYALLERALDKTHRAGVATFVMRGREYLVALKSEDGVLTLHTLHWADEIRDPREEIPDLPSSRTKTGAKELKMAEQVVSALGMAWDPEEFHDTYQEKVAALIKAKQAGETVDKAEPPAEATNVVDLTEALRASVERARGERKRTGAGSRAKSGARSGARSRAKSGAKSGTRSGAKPEAKSGTKTAGRSRTRAGKGTKSRTEPGAKKRTSTSGKAA